MTSVELIRAHYPERASDKEFIIRLLLADAKSFAAHPAHKPGQWIWVRYAECEGECIGEALRILYDGLPETP